MIQVHDLVLGNIGLKMYEIAVSTVSFSKDRVSHIQHDMLGKKNLWACAGVCLLQTSRPISISFWGCAIRRIFRMVSWSSRKHGTTKAHQRLRNNWSSRFRLINYFQRRGSRNDESHLFLKFATFDLCTSTNRKRIKWLHGFTMLNNGSLTVSTSNCRVNDSI